MFFFFSTLVETYRDYIAKKSGRNNEKKMKGILSRIEFGMVFFLFSTDYANFCEKCFGYIFQPNTQAFKCKFACVHRMCYVKMVKVHVNQKKK